MRIIQQYKILLFISLCFFSKSFCQPLPVGQYTVTGYFFHPSTGRSIYMIKELDSIDVFRLEGGIGDLGGTLGGSYEFQFDMINNNTFGNFTTADGIPLYADFMTLDNPGGVDYTTCGCNGGNVPGDANYNISIYDNHYDPVTKTFWLHYGYGSGGPGQNNFTRQLYEKWAMITTPAIKSFTPIYSCSSTTVTINGFNFTGATSVKFGTLNATSFVVNSSTTITAIAPQGVSGQITIITPQGTCLSASTYSSNFSTADFAYIPNNALSIINVSTNTLLGDVSIESGGYGVTVAPDGSNVYVSGLSDVTAFNPATNTSIVIPVASAGGLSVSPDGSKLYVADYYGDQINIINTTDNTSAGAITVGSGPDGICFSPDGSKAYVTNNNDNTISVINTGSNTVSTTIPGRNYPEGICISPDGSKIYVANSYDSSVSVINASTNTIITNIRVGKAPAGICITPNGNNIYVANYTSNTVSVINTLTNTLLTTITLATNSRPWGISVTPDGSNVYVATSGTFDVSIINTSTNTVTGTILVNGTAYAFGNFIGTFRCPSCTSNSWNGTVSTAWENAANWSCGTIPGPNTDVYIDAGKPRYPIIHSFVFCKSLHEAAGSAVTVATGYKLNIKAP
jgi:YVTN family beta-propeller protein